MVKHIPLPADLLDTAVGGAGGVGALALFSAVKSHVAVADQRTPKAEIPIRIAGGRVAQLVVFLRRIDKIVGLPDFADAAALKKGVSLKIRRIRNALGRFFQGQHIVTQYSGIGPQGSGLLQKRLGRLAEHPGVHLGQHKCVPRLYLHAPEGTRAEIQPYHTLVIHNSRVKADGILIGRAIRILHNTVVFVASVRRIADRHADGVGIPALALPPGKAVVQVKPPVAALHHIGRVEIAGVGGIARVLLGRIIGTLACPVGQIIQRGRIKLIILQAKALPARRIV